MYIAFVGSRDFASESLVRRIVRRAEAKYGDLLVVVSGGAPGVDTWAEDEARRLEVATLIFPARWTRHGKAAGFRRNPRIVAHADVVVAFWDGVSSGTQGTIALAREAAKPLILYQADGTVLSERGSAR